MTTWIFGMDAEYVELPGPAEWWPENYDYEKHGFAVPAVDNGYQEAFAMVFSDEEPERYAFVFPSDDDLRVMEDTPEARLIQRQML
jgi:hypothetical protein